MTAAASAATPSTSRLAQAGSVAGVAAAVAVTAGAVLAKAADVSLEVDGRAIPVPAFAWWTLVAAVLGTVLARVLHERQRFVIVTTVATVLSLLPAVLTPDDTSTRAVLVVAHLLAAVIIIPTLARVLAPAPRDR